MKNIYFCFFLFLSTSFSLMAQMSNGKYGDEWINFEQQYFKISIAEDGMYRIDGTTLSNAGVPIANINANQYQLFRMGEQVPIYINTTSNLQANNYIEFYGEKNRSDLDRFLFENPDEEMLNPQYSLYTDTISYFLTWSETPNGERFQEVNNELNNLPAVEPYYYHLIEEVYGTKSNGTSGHVKNRINSQGLAYSNFLEGDGFSFGFRKKTTKTISIDEVNTIEASTYVRTRFTVNNPTNPVGHEQTVEINDTQVYSSTTLEDFEVVEETFEINTSDLGNRVKLEIEGFNGNNDRQALAIFSVRYPRNFNFNNASEFSFSIEASNTRKYLEIENFDAGTQAPILYDLTNKIRIITQLENGKVKVVLPASSSDRQLVLVATTGGTSLNSSITESSFTDYSQIPTQYLIISNPRLYFDNAGVNQVQRYADYRSSAEGGGYTTRVIDIQNLYDQFAYGIKKHPLSVKNFVHKVKAEWGETFQYLFIIGKGREYLNTRSASEQVNSQSTFFIPTYGYPGSDNMLVSANGSFTPMVPMGRLAIVNGEEVGIYLNKVLDLENNQRNAPYTLEGRKWMKEVLHLGGGGNDGERSVIRNYLLNLEETIEENAYGARVTSVFKQNNDPVQQSNSTTIFDRINKGVSLITFFGHSGVGTFDFDIDDPSNYDNQGKTPMMISLGCYSGNIHTSTRGASERFINYESKGAIAFAATTGLGYINPLYRLAQNFYDFAGGSAYGEGVGKILQASLEDYAANSTSVSTVTLLQQFTFQGDPSVRLSVSEGPDFTIDPSSVSTTPEIVNVQDSSFTLNFKLVNLGKGISDSLGISIAQQFPDGSNITVHELKVATPKGESELSFVIPTYGEVSVGRNKILVEVDYLNEIDETPSATAENNNTLISSSGEVGYNFYIRGKGISMVYPKNYDIVNNRDFQLIANTLDPFLAPTEIYFQIDTVKTFNSDFLTSQTLTQGGGLVKWQPSIEWESERVYFWRVATTPENGEAFNWRTQSFTFIENSSYGWDQSNYQQLEENNLENISIDSLTKKLQFFEDVQFFRIINNIWEAHGNVEYLNNGQNWGSPARYQINEGLYVIVREANNLNYWTNPPGGAYNSVNNEGLIIPFPFRTNTVEERENFMNFLQDTIPSGSYVTIYSMLRTFNNSYSPELWAQDETSGGRSIFTLLEEQGATEVRNLETRGSVPYVFIYKKDEGALNEEMAEDVNGIIDITQDLSGLWYEGNIKSSLIGPAASWKELIWKNSSNDASESDSLWVSVYGVNPNANLDTLLLQTNDRYQESIDLSDFSAEAYPYLRLTFNSYDEVQRTSAHLDTWRVLYEGLPDFIPNPALGFELNKDTLQQGEELIVNMTVENVSPFASDSLLIKYNFVDEQNNTVVAEEKIAPFAAWEAQQSHWTLSTKALTGLQRLSIELNPDEEQKESVTNNNFINKEFLVKTDKTNPVLEVTFDGIHIMDEDLVSSKPHIQINLKDENPYFELTDTSLIRTLIVTPTGETQYIDYSNEDLEFIPAASPEDKALIHYRPHFLEDGTYELIVQAQDATGNLSGAFDYKVKFQIINERSISQVLNYPNPFSSRTRFVYTLTGDVSPEKFVLQIFTVSGKIVKEVSQDEMGPLRIGTHQTDYVWDGTDEYGDKLANGTYLYKLTIKDQEGKDYKRMSNSADQFFKKGFGKMVIMR